MNFQQLFIDGQCHYFIQQKKLYSIQEDTGSVGAFLSRNMYVELEAKYTIVLYIRCKLQQSLLKIGIYFHSVDPACFCLLPCRLLEVNIEFLYLVILINFIVADITTSAMFFKCLCVCCSSSVCVCAVLQVTVFVLFLKCMCLCFTLLAMLQLSHLLKANLFLIRILLTVAVWDG